MRDPIQVLRDYVGPGSNIAKCLDTTINGDGNSLHDVKHSFDYVIKTIKENSLAQKGFGQSVISQAEETINKLSDFWIQIDLAKKSILEFCDNQDAIDSRHL